MSPLPRAVAALCVLLMPVTSLCAADRVVGLSSFDRVRVDAPVTLRVETGPSPAARVSGGGAGEAIEVRQSGTTIIVARRQGWQERAEVDRGAGPVVVTLTAPAIAAATVNAGARVSVARAAGPRVELTVVGGGTLAVERVEAEQAVLTLVGNGALTVAAGRAASARILTNGPGTIDAGGMEAGALTVRVDGAGETRARARYTASVANAGAGQVVVLGQPRCTVRPAGGGPVTCGEGAAR